MNSRMLKKIYDLYVLQSEMIEADLRLCGEVYFFLTDIMERRDGRTHLRDISESYRIIFVSMMKEMLS